MNKRAARTITGFLGGVPISTVMLLSIAAGSLAHGSAGLPSDYWEDLPGCVPCRDYQIVTLDQSPYREQGLAGWIVREEDGQCILFILRATLNRECVIAHEKIHGSKCKHHPKYRYAIECAHFLGESAFF